MRKENVRALRNVLLGLLPVIIVIANLVRPFIDLYTVYHYSTRDGKMGMTEGFLATTGHFEDIGQRITLYKKENPAATDTIMYRTFRREPLKFWRWYSYLSDPRYDLPYLDPKEIPDIPADTIRHKPME